MLTVKDVCKNLGVSVRTVYRLIKSGKLPAKRLAGQWRFEHHDIDSLLTYKSPAEYVMEFIPRRWRGAGMTEGK
jgi:excisionase family DNA binding protein